MVLPQLRALGLTELRYASRYLSVATRDVDNISRFCASEGFAPNYAKKMHVFIRSSIIATLVYRRVDGPQSVSNATLDSRWRAARVDKCATGAFAARLSFVYFSKELQLADATMTARLSYALRLCNSVTLFFRLFQITTLFS